MRAPLVIAALAAALVAVPVAAQTAKNASAAKPAGLGVLGGSGKEPIKIDADRLDVFDRESKAVFAGNVVAVQGDATIRCSALTVHYKRGKRPEEAAGSDAEPAEKNAAMAENGIQRVECAGPVTVKQKDQVATGDSATFDQVARRITLAGNVVLSQCQNVTRGSRLVYDMNTGRANMDPGAGGRVSAMFVPGEKAEAKGGGTGCAAPDIAGRSAKGSERGADRDPSKPAPRAQAN